MLRACDKKRGLSFLIILFQTWVDDGDRTHDPQNHNLML